MVLCIIMCIRIIIAGAPGAAAACTCSMHLWLALPKQRINDNQRVFQDQKASTKTNIYINLLDGG
jgi:hypothetical protein